MAASSEPTTATVGQSLAHESARLHVTGAAPYIDDLPEPIGTLHVAPGWSRQAARGRIRRLDLEAVRQAAPHDGRLDAQVVHEVLRHGIRLQLEERLARVDAPDLKDLLPCQIRYAADFHALQREDRRVDHDGHDEAAGRQEQESLKKPPAAAMFFLLLLLQSLSPCTKKRRTMPESGAANQ